MPSSVEIDLNSVNPAEILDVIIIISLPEALTVILIEVQI